MSLSLYAKRTCIFRINISVHCRRIWFLLAELRTTQQHRSKDEIVERRVHALRERSVSFYFALKETTKIKRSTAAAATTTAITAATTMHNAMALLTDTKRSHTLSLILHYVWQPFAERDTVLSLIVLIGRAGASLCERERAKCVSITVGIETTQWWCARSRCRDRDSFHFILYIYNFPVLIFYSVCELWIRSDEMRRWIDRTTNNTKNKNAKE